MQGGTQRSRVPPFDYPKIHIHQEFTFGVGENTTLGSSLAWNHLGGGTFVCRAGEGTFRLGFETWAILVTAPFGMGLGKNGSTSALGATP